MVMEVLLSMFFQSVDATVHLTKTLVLVAATLPNVHDNCSPETFITRNAIHITTGKLVAKRLLEALDYWQTNNDHVNL